MAYITCYCNNGTVSCRKCNGSGTIGCPVCSEAGNVSCRKCSGSGNIGCPVCSATGNVSCRKCDGTGEIDCPVCYRSGYVSCRPCEGNGTLVCRKCEGNCNISCPVCDGSGYYADSGRPCRVCDGSGSVECRKCSGSGSVTCFKCDGSGQVQCRACEGSCRVTCRKCSGTGEVQCHLCQGSQEVTCRRCEGTGGVTCLACEGTRQVSCKKCDGTGDVTCKRCDGSGKVESPWETRQCAWRDGCSNEIRYHKDANRIPTLCTEHIAQIKRLQELREAEQAKWHEKPCGYCKKTIRWHENRKEYDYCRECNTWLTKPCAAQDCNGGEIRYKVFFEDVAEYCKSCKSGDRYITERRPRPDGGWDEYTGKGYVNKNGVIVFVDDKEGGKHSHTVYNADGTLRGHRDEGHGKEFERDDLSRTNCERCGDYFDFPSNRDFPPKFCRECWEIVKEEREERNRQEAKSCDRCGEMFDYPAHFHTPPKYCRPCSKLMSYKAETRDTRLQDREQYAKDHIADEYKDRGEKAEKVGDLLEDAASLLEKLNDLNKGQ